jgi:hypothetical protein
MQCIIFFLASCFCIQQCIISASCFRRSCSNAPWNWYTFPANSTLCLCTLELLLLIFCSELGLHLPYLCHQLLSANSPCLPSIAVPLRAPTSPHHFVASLFLPFEEPGVKILSNKRVKNPLSSSNMASPVRILKDQYKYEGEGLKCVLFRISSLT